MAPRGGSTRGGHGEAQNRSSRGRGLGSTGRGASTSSSSPSPQANIHEPANLYEQERIEHAAKRAQRRLSNTPLNGRGGRGGRERGNHVNKQVRFADASSDGENTRIASTSKLETSKPTTSIPGPSPFSSSAMSSFPASGFLMPASQKPLGSFATTSSTSTTEPFNPFAKPLESNLFHDPPKTESSSTSSTSSPYSFGGSSSTKGSFGAPSKFGSNSFSPTSPMTNIVPVPLFPGVLDRLSATSLNPFTPDTLKINGSASFVLQPTPASFGAPSIFNASASKMNQTTVFSNSNPAASIHSTSSNPSAAVTQQANVGGVFPPSQAPASQSALITFSAPSVTSFSSSTTPTRSKFGLPSVPGLESSNEYSNSSRTIGPPNQTPSPASPFFKPTTSKPTAATEIVSHSRPNTNTLRASNGSQMALAEKIDWVLREKRIVKPKWPAVNLEEYPNRNAHDFPITNYRLELIQYREKVRNSLIKANLLDQPGVAKRLSEALEFKGTCEDMCPEFEIAERILEGRSDNAEKTLFPNGHLSHYPLPEKMVKVLARSSAGQETPLPSDVRTVGALRRTVDYLLQEMLAKNELRAVHNFIWDRSRAVRRDFVFHSSMSPLELRDQVYCLELITRFHVTTLHLMAKEKDLSAAEYVEQQEGEQLGKTLLSLVHAYEDCKSQGVECENEAEFRAYYILFHDEDSGILETVQTWGWKFWGESQEIQTAVALVEMLQSTWQPIGPFKPNSETDVAQNAFSRFFSIVEDKGISYTMACFAEIKFNKVRESLLRTILASYRRQKDQTKDWTLSKLNTYLRFDNETEAFSFCTARGLHIEEGIDGEEYLSFDLGEMTELPKEKQIHSYALVERKRGNHSLPELINSTICEEAEQDLEIIEAEEDEGLFVKDDSGFRPPVPPPTNLADDLPEEVSSQVDFSSPTQPAQSQPASVQANSLKTTSLFDRISRPPISKVNFSSKRTEGSAAQVKATQSSNPPSPANNKTKQTSPVFNLSSSQVVLDRETSSPFSFLKSPPEKPTETLEITPPSNPSMVSTAVKQSPKSSFFSPHQPSFPSVAVNNPRPFCPAKRPADNQKPLPPLVLGPSQIPNSTSQNGANNTHPAQATSNKPVPNLSPLLSLGVPSISPAKSLRDVILKPKSEAGQPEAKTLFGVTPAPLERSARLDGVANWYTLGQDGLLDHFTSFQIEQILREVVAVFANEKAEQVSRKAQEAARAKQREARYFNLATEYFIRWRKLAQRARLRRRGREARKARLELAESVRVSKAAQSANIVEEFRASVNGKRRTSLESLLRATGVLNVVHNPTDELQAILQHGLPGRPLKRQRAQTSLICQSSTSTRDKQADPDSPLRRSLFSDPSYLSGGSRIHLISDYSSLDGRHQVSGVQTDYFRLKARGITTLPNGTPLATSAAKSLLRKKSSLDFVQSQMNSPPPPPKSQSLVGSVPASSTTRGEKLRGSAQHEEEIQALKHRAKEMMAESNVSRQKRSFVDDEELFARAKRVREQMDEGAEWFRKERERRSIS